eukprot:SAG22_NODE_651_length_8155_cov_20.230884_9_plen_130_part_00
MLWFYCNLLLVLIAVLATAVFTLMLTVAHAVAASICSIDGDDAAAALDMSTEDRAAGPELWSDSYPVIVLYWLQPLWVPVLVSCGRKVAWRFGGNQLLPPPEVQPPISVLKPVAASDVRIDVGNPPAGP